MNRLSRVIVAGTFLSFATTFGYGQAFEGTVDWENQAVRATGFGVPNPNAPKAAQRIAAFRAAKLDAFRNILETVKGINVSSETTVRDFVTESDLIRTSVEGVLKNFKVVDTRYMSDGSVEVDVEMPIAGALTSAIMPVEVFSERRELSPVFQTSDSYTGLIIDARGTGVRPAMSPRIVDEGGNEVYGTGYVSREFAVKIGVVGYARDIDAAKKDSRISDNPMVIKAKSSTGTNMTDVVISDDDARRIHGVARNNNFLDKCRVMFIVD